MSTKNSTMTPDITDLVTMGGSAVIGKGLHLASAVIRELSNARREAWTMGETSMERANSVSGGTWVRRGIYLLVAFSFVSIIIAGFAGVPVVVENEIVTLNLDTRYVKADEVEKLLEPVFSSVDAVDEVEDKVDIHRVEFDAYLKHASEKFDGIERLVLRVDDKLDRLIEMEHTE